MAGARRDAEIIKGQADAERNRIYAEAFQKDPEFFAFFRSMQAYTSSLGGDNTTMVLKPDSEFFRFFGGQKRAGQAAPAPASPAPAAQTVQ